MATLLKKKDLRAGSVIYPAKMVERLPKWLQRSTVVKANGDSASGYARVENYLADIMPDDFGKNELKTTLDNHKRYVKGAETDVKKKRKAVSVFKNVVAFATIAKIREDAGEQWARWVPSSAKEPDSEHMTYYGRVFKVSEGINGELPADRYGCQCGIQFISEAEAKRSL